MEYSGFQEKSCVLSFDGMKLCRSLHYMKNDSISGFEEIGYGNMTNKVANEMIVFMVRGISTKWKQVRDKTY